MYPDFNSLERRILGARWFGLELPRHTLQCTSGSVEGLCQRAGFVSVITEPLGNSYLPESICDLRLVRPLVPRDSRFYGPMGSVIPQLAKVLTLLGNSGSLVTIASKREDGVATDEMTDQ